MTAVSAANQLDAPAITGAFGAVAEGAATDEQRYLRDAVIAALADVVDDPDIVAVIAAAVGPFGVVYDTPYEELSALKKWVRDQAADADRSTPALNTMASAYDQLLAAGDNSGPPLRLAKGVNVIGLDSQCRRWLVAGVSKDAITAIRNADDDKAAWAAARRRGAVRFHWSVERTGLVPDPDDIAERLPLPTGGRYLIGYRGGPGIVTRPKFIAAMRKLAGATPVADLLVWHTGGETPALYSLRGLMGHADGADCEWPDDVATDAEALRAALWP